MNTLGEAWEWYICTRDNLDRMRRIGNRYWNSIPWDADVIGRDDEFRTLEAADIVTETEVGLKSIDDLAVIVLFSVFEAVVRTHLATAIRPEADSLADPILRHAAEDAVQGVEEGSFFLRVLDPLGKQVRIPQDLITQVNQVRVYRNWAAHGRRSTPTNNVSPKAAYDRLKAFLDALGIAVETEQPGPPRPRR